MLGGNYVIHIPMWGSVQFHMRARSTVRLFALSVYIVEFSISLSSKKLIIGQLSIVDIDLCIMPLCVTCLQ